MSFLKLFKTEHKTEHKTIVESTKSTKKSVHEAKDKPEELLRTNGLKIKMVTPTSFGIQIDFAKKYDEEEIKDILSDFNIKIKNKSVFIVD